MSLGKKNIMLLTASALIMFIPIWLLPEAEFSGADGQAMEMIIKLAPDYKPWFESVFTLPSSEVESLLFALQAAIGAGIVGFVLGRISGKNKC